MKKIILINKKEGETPLEALEVFRKKNSEYKDREKIRMTYAGRLDPMARGLMIVLSGDETHNKDKYLKLGKEYEFEILFGFATDTYDILGKVVASKHFQIDKRDLEKLIKRDLKQFTGKFIQRYPVYSSKTVKGKQLFEYARAGEDVELPQREVQVSNLKFLKLRKINSKKLLQNIEKRVKKVKGDFRQKEILKIWQKDLAKNPSSFFIGSFKIKCSSGTYVRGIANSLGENMGIPALALFIKRTKIGNYTRRGVK